MRLYFLYEDGETGERFHVQASRHRDDITLHDIRADEDGLPSGSNLISFLNDETILNIELFAEQYMDAIKQ